MITVKKMTESAEECLGWPYVSPGSNDSRGIDCSGLFVKIFRDQGASIYHGSNTIYRKYCTDKGKLTSAKQLCEGMAVFKWNPNTPDKFDDNLGDFQHIGYVAGVNPLRIIHASTGTMCVTTDSTIGKWKYWGRLKGVDYGDTGDIVHPDQKEMDKQEGFVMYLASLEGGNPEAPINIRVKPDGALQDRVDQGTLVTVLAESGNWCKVEYNKDDRAVTGYVMGEFVVVSDKVPDADQRGDDPAEEVNVSLSMTREEAETIVRILDRISWAASKAVGGMG